MEIVPSRAWGLGVVGPSVESGCTHGFFVVGAVVRRLKTIPPPSYWVGPRSVPPKRKVPLRSGLPENPLVLSVARLKTGQVLGALVQLARSSYRKASCLVLRGLPCMYVLPGDAKFSELSLHVRMDPRTVWAAREGRRGIRHDGR